MSGFTETQISAALDCTFTHVGGRRIAVPHDFIPSHQQPFADAGRNWITETKARAILEHVRASARSGRRPSTSRQPQHRQRHFKRQDMEAPAGGKLWSVLKAAGVAAVNGMVPAATVIVAAKAVQAEAPASRAHSAPAFDQGMRALCGRAV